MSVTGDPVKATILETLQRLGGQTPENKARVRAILHKYANDNNTLSAAKLREFLTDLAALQP
jgi:hypothetical protein